jgi:ABC-type xylose transport system substrate-binding protein
VIAYDRPIPDKPADFYVSFDNEGIGYAISQSLVNHLQESGVPKGPASCKLTARRPMPPQGLSAMVFIVG